MDSAAKKTLEEIGKGLEVSPEELGLIRRERGRQRLRLAIISLIAFVASLIAGAAIRESIGETVSPRRTYPLAAALPFLAISSGRRRTHLLVVISISAVAFVWGYLIMQIALPGQPQPPGNALYAVFGREQ